MDYKQGCRSLDKASDCIRLSHYPTGCSATPSRQLHRAGVLRHHDILVSVSLDCATMPLATRSAASRSPTSAWRGTTGHAFLGLVGYYYDFIQDYETIAVPLVHLLRKDTFQWGSRQRRRSEPCSTRSRRHQFYSSPTSTRASSSNAMHPGWASVLCFTRGMVRSHSSASSSPPATHRSQRMSTSSLAWSYDIDGRIFRVGHSPLKRTTTTSKFCSIRSSPPSRNTSG
jgi:hypothetical protein